MGKLVARVLVLAACLALAGCGEGKNDDGKNDLPSKGKTGRPAEQRMAGGGSPARG